MAPGRARRLIPFVIPPFPETRHGRAGLFPSCGVGPIQRPTLWREWHQPSGLGNRQVPGERVIASCLPREWPIERGGRNRARTRGARTPDPEYDGLDGLRDHGIWLLHRCISRTVTHAAVAHRRICCRFLPGQCVTLFCSAVNCSSPMVCDRFVHEAATVGRCGCARFCPLGGVPGMV